MISQNIVEKLFDSSIKIKLFRLFLRNPNFRFSYAEIKDKLLIQSDREPAFQEELKKLREMGFVVAEKKNGKKDSTEEKDYIYHLNRDFTFLKELQDIIFRSSPVDQDKMAEKIHNLGKVRLAAIGGVFMGAKNNTLVRTDMIVVSDVISERRFSNFIKSVESEVGVEVKYTLLSIEEYEYRVKMFDRFLRDFFEKPHHVILGGK